MTTPTRNQYPTHTPSRLVNGSCSIVPPYILDALSRSDDSNVSKAASRTLQHDVDLRRERETNARQERPSASASGSSPKPGTPGGVEAVNRQIYDAGGKITLPGTLVRAEGAPATDDVSATEAYDGLGDTWRFYHDVFGRNSIDDAGLSLIGSVHYSKKYDNAFWNGEQMVFGDGDGVIFGRFTVSVDVIGHELTHGVTQETAGLVYSGQPGALNESMSDVFGVLVKQYALGQTADQADWLIGAGLLAPGVKGRALRDMLHPGTAYDDPHLGVDPQPADMAHFVKTTDDNGGVHINSGIPNRAFALAATTIGGHAWEVAGRVWFDVLTGAKIQAHCDFATFASLTIDAAGARYGVDSAQAAAIRQAWVSVGVVSASSTSGVNEPGSSASPAADAAVEVRRTGGIAGLNEATTVHLDQLAGNDADHWQQLLSQQLPALAGVTPDHLIRDGFIYHVLCHAHDLDVALPEDVIPEETRLLLDRTLRQGADQPRSHKKHKKK